ncbi:MAG TPA: SDR family NAD(P)-dependent oxidoreductase [Mariprofundaceae bacterium]|nr:SDR family NAD(P)-dependent oxidoreductase [Mariprofundaceae bacterium]
MSKRFENKIIMVTGASSGLGRAIAQQLGAEGASVIAIGRVAEALEVTQARIEEAGGRCLCIPFDLTDFDNYGKLFLALKDQIPHLDGLVHCGGSLKRCAPMQYVKPDVFRGALDIHLTAPNLLTQIMFPLLKRAESASIIFTTCDMIEDDQPNWHGYGLAKRALGYAAAMWQAEHPAKAMRFNTINPGRMRTRSFERAYPGLNPETVPLASDIAPVFLQILSDEARETRGQLLQASDLLERALN